MKEPRFYKLLPGYARVIKRDIQNGEVVFLRSDVAKGIRSPYGYNRIVRNGKIGIRGMPAERITDLYKWVYCADLCKKVLDYKSI